MNRTKILQALNAAYPFKLLRRTLLADLRLDGAPVPDCAFDSDLQALSAKGFVEISRDEIDATKLYLKITEAGIRYLESKGIA